MPYSAKRRRFSESPSFPSHSKRQTPILARACTILLIILGLAACVSAPQQRVLPGRHSCEAFFIYIICVGDIDRSGDVDYVYFGDDYQIFMYARAMREALNALGQPWHRCVVPMSERTREHSSRLLYGAALGLSERLAVKGKLLRSYRASQSAIEACNTRGKNPGKAPQPDEPDDAFVVEDDWEESLD